MKKMSEYARKLDDLLKLFVKLVIIFATVGIVIMGAFAFIPALTDQITGTWTLELGDVKLTLAEAITDNTAFLHSQAVAIILQLAVSAGILWYGCVVLRKILTSIGNEQPFDGTVSGNVSKLGKVLVVASVANNVAECIGKALIYHACNINELLQSDMIVGVTTEFTLVDAELMFTGALVILLSYVFKYGEELQKQADETL